jgi:AraC-like DNA-binding protein
LDPSPQEPSVFRPDRGLPGPGGSSLPRRNVRDQARSGRHTSGGHLHEGAEELKDRATYFWFHFTLPDAPVLLEEAEAGAILLDPIVAKQRIDEGALLPLCFSVNNPESIFQSFHELLFEQENPSYTCTRLQLMFRNLLISLTDSVLASRRQTGDRGSRSSAAFLIVTYLAEHMTDSNLSIKSAADAIGLNPDYAGRRFRETMGISVGDYILKKRMELAMRHLQEAWIPSTASRCSADTAPRGISCASSG